MGSDVDEEEKQVSRRTKSILIQFLSVFPLFLVALCSLVALSSCSLMKNQLDTWEYLKSLLLFSISSAFTYQPTSRSNNQWQCSSNTYDSVILNCKREARSLSLFSSFFIFLFYHFILLKLLSSFRERQRKQKTNIKPFIDLCVLACRCSFMDIFSSLFQFQLLCQKF